MKYTLIVVISIVFSLTFSKLIYSQQGECKVLLESISGQYTGDCKKGLAHGDGTAIGVDVYTGKFKKGLPHGDGIYTWASGDFYTGKFKEGKKEGLGKLKLADGTVAKEGIWKDDEFFKEQEVPDYTIMLRRNVLNVAIRNLETDEDKLEIILVRDGKESTQNVYDLLVVTNTGIQYSDGHSIVYKEITYPIKANIKFKYAGKLSTTTVTGMGSNEKMTTEITQMPQAAVEFEIREKGTWEVRIKY